MLKTSLLTAAILSAASAATALEADIRAKPIGGGTPSIVGVTNLPDDTKLMISLRRKEANYFAQATTNVRGNQFQSDQFTAFGKSLAPGDYILEITMPLPAIQSAAVRKMIGENGEQLTGKLVKKGQFGTVLRISGVVNIGGASSATADSASRQDSDAAMVKWRKENCEWIASITQGGRTVADCLKALSKPQ